jgi:16S rRNA (adenine1518-N6/adenine1519-N6)-dimethyltransferase
LQAFLKEKGVHAKKGLSQNFLIDGNIVQKIVATARVEPGDFIVEIGPGPGALTQALLEKGAHVLAVEMDTLFADALTRLQTSDSRLKVACADILAFPLQDALGKQGNKKAKIVANLPYHITTPILALLLPLHTLVDSLTIMVQKEFADRMAASPKTPEYSSFTVFLQFYASLDKSFAVSPHCFFPKPTVHSAVVHCTLHPPLLENGAEGFFQMTRTAFGQRRKMLRSSLKDLFRAENIEHALAHIGHPGTARPEELRIDEFISLYVALKRNRLLPQPESPLSP